jgi:hypothetical protein
MSRTDTNGNAAGTNTNGNAAATAATQLVQRARQAAEAAKPLAAQVKPLASDARQAVGRGVYRARVWAAPQVERTGQVFQDTVAPKVADALHSSAQKLDPGQPPHRSWRKGAAVISILLAAAATAVAAMAARKRKAQSAASVDAEESGETTRAGDEASASADGIASADGQVTDPARTS